MKIWRIFRRGRGKESEKSPPVPTRPEIRTFHARTPRHWFQLWALRHQCHEIDFFSHLTERNLVKYAVKRSNTFMAVKTEKFLDIANYLAPGFSYSQYLNVYGCSEEKGHFPYEWMTSRDKLNVSQLLPHAAFFSTLKNQNICARDNGKTTTWTPWKSSRSGTTTKTYSRR